MEETVIYNVTVMMQSGKFYKIKVDTSKELNYLIECLMYGQYRYQIENCIIYIKSQFVESIEIWMEEKPLC